MFNFGQQKDLVMLAVLGIGLYTQSSEINLANNTTILLLLFMQLMERGTVSALEDSAILERRALIQNGIDPTVLNPITARLFPF
jgi:hypothetical protein